MVLWRNPVVEEPVFCYMNHLRTVDLATVGKRSRKH